MPAGQTATPAYWPLPASAAPVGFARPPSTVTQVSEIVPIAPPVGAPFRDLSKPATISTTADLEREYVSSEGWGWVTEYARTLPQYVDDVTMQFGYDLYRRMRHDPQTDSAVSTFSMATLAQGYSIAPNIEKGNEGFEQSQKIADTVKRVLDRLRSPLPDVLQEMIGMGASYGYKVAEQVYEYVTWPKSEGPVLALKNLRTKPQNATAFVVDAYNNVLGLVYTRPGAPIPSLSILTPSMLTSTKLPNGTTESPIIIPRAKFWVFSWQAENGDPRGTSILRPAYHAWWVKAQVWRSYLSYLATFAQPSVIGYVSANAEPEYRINSDGTTSLVKTPQETMRLALEKIQNGAVGAFANDEKVEALEVVGDGQVFVTAINVVNREITKAVIRQTLTTDEGEHMARAASEVHQDVFGLLVRYAKSSLAGSFTRDVIEPLVRYNYGEDAARDFLPIFRLGETEHQDFANDANAISNLVRAGFFDESQYRPLDDYLGVPARDPETWARKIAQAEALVNLAVATTGANTAASTLDKGQPSASAGAQSTSGQPSVAGGSNDAGAQSQSLVGQDVQALAARLVAKASAMRIADRLGVVGPA